VEKDASISKSQIAKTDITSNVKVTADSVVVTFDLGGAPVDNINMNDIDLQISSTQILLDAPFGRSNVDLNFSIDKDSVAAKLSKKKKTLKLTLSKK